MKLVVFDLDFVDGNGHPLTVVVKQCAVDAPLAGLRCDAIMLHSFDIARLRGFRPDQLQEWLNLMALKLNLPKVGPGTSP